MVAQRKREERKRRRAAEEAKQAAEDAAKAAKDAAEAKAAASKRARKSSPELSTVKQVESGTHMLLEWQERLLTWPGGAWHKWLYRQAAQAMAAAAKALHVCAYQLLGAVQAVRHDRWAASL